MRIVDSARVVTDAPFLKSRHIVPEVPDEAFPIYRDSVPEVPYPVPEIPSLPHAGGRWHQWVKRVLLLIYPMYFNALINFRKAVWTSYLPVLPQYDESSAG
jgi:hypothetical protein